MTNYNDFKGKTCIITGAASGIGRAVAIKLGQAGASLALSDVNEDGLAETAKLAGAAQSNRIITDRLDVGDADAIAKYAGHTQAALGDADYVFNIAGLTRIGQFEDTPAESFEKVMDVNFYGVVRMCKAYLSQVKSTKGGLVNISSLFGIVGFPGQTEYCASKFAVRGFSEALAQELDGTGVSISCVHPGGVATNIARNAEVDAMPTTGESREDMNAGFDKAAITTPEKAADIILTGTLKKKRRIIVGKDAKFLTLITRLFPVGYHKFIRRIAPEAYDALDVT
ncbi:MAG: SDR family NAD(P)-dependent oxidoreductase [Maricaulaceae bacterium]